MIDPTISTVGMPPDLLPSLLEGLVQANRVLLSSEPYPSVYESGVVYRPEGRGQESWRLANEILRSGHGDCEDLVAWRVAELRNQGANAWPDVLKSDQGFHAIVSLENGGIEDPSMVLMPEEYSDRSAFGVDAQYSITYYQSGYLATVWIGGNVGNGWAIHPVDALYQAAIDAVSQAKRSPNISGLGWITEAIAVVKLLDEARKDPEIREAAKKGIDEALRAISYGRGERQWKVEDEDEVRKPKPKPRQRRRRRRKRRSGRNRWDMDMNMDMLGQRRRRRRGGSGRGGSGRGRRRRRRRRRRNPYEEMQEKLTRIEENRRKRENAARRGIQKHKRKMRKLQSSLNEETRELESDLREIQAETQKAVYEIQQAWNMYAPYYAQGYDVVDELQQIRTAYYDVVTQYQDQAALIDSEIEDLESAYQDEISYLEEQIEYSEDYIERVREEAEQAKEQTRDIYQQVSPGGGVRT
jgi:hypothetical protein